MLYSPFGRCIRKSKRKKYFKKIGHIVIPIYLNENENELNTNAYDKVWQIINAMKDHDSELKIELENLRMELGRRREVVI